MPSTLTRVSESIERLASPDITFPPAGIAAGFTGYPGDFVKLTSGTVAQAAATSNTILTAIEVGVLNDLVQATAPLGVATATVVGIEKVSPDTIVEVPIATSSGGSVGTPVGIATPATTIPTIVGNRYGISRNSLGIYYLNTAITDGSTDLLAEIVNASTRWPLSDTFPAVLVKIIPANQMA